MEGLGKRLKEKRKSLCLTLKDVENFTNISNSYMSQLENGKIVNPGIQTILELCTVYNMTFKELTDGL